MFRAPGRLLFDFLRPAQLAADGRLAATFRSWSLAASADSPPPADAEDHRATSQSQGADAATTESVQVRHVFLTKRSEWPGWQFLQLKGLPPPVAYGQLLDLAQLCTALLAVCSL